MKKLLRLVIISLVCVVSLALLVAYSLFRPYKLSDITDFRRDEIPVSVTVQYMDAYEGLLVMTDKDEIMKLIELLSERRYSFSNANPMPGNNRYLTFYYSDGTEVSFSAYSVKGKFGRFCPNHPTNDSVSAILEAWAKTSDSVDPQ